MNPDRFRVDLRWMQTSALVALDEANDSRHSRLAHLKECLDENTRQSRRRLREPMLEFRRLGGQAEVPNPDAASIRARSESLCAEQQSALSDLERDVADQEQLSNIACQNERHGIQVKRAYLENEHLWNLAFAGERAAPTEREFQDRLAPLQAADAAAEASLLEFEERIFAARRHIGNAPQLHLEADEDTSESLGI